jgi:phosphoglycerol transferase MdoB-like AlkP superfamily enzyme
VIKNVFSFGIIAALCTMATMTTIALIGGAGIASLLLGGITLPFSYVAALILGIPLLYFQNKFPLNVFSWLAIYIVVSLFGVVFVLVMLGTSVAGLLENPLSYISTYGLAGALSAIVVWYFSVFSRK